MNLSATLFQEFLLFLPALVCFFWAITLAVDWKRNWRVQNIWTVILLVGAVNSFYWTYIAGVDPVLLSRLTHFVTFTHAGFYALLYLFYRALIDQSAFTWKEYAVLIPPVLVGGIFTICTIVLGTSYFEVVMKSRVELLPSATNLAYTVQFLIGSYINNVLALIYINVVLVLLIFRKIRSKDNVRSFFSLPEGSDEIHIKRLVEGLLVFLICMFIFLVGDFLYSIEDFIPFYVLFAVQGILFYMISFHVYHLRDQESGERSSQSNQCSR